MRVLQWINDLPITSLLDVGCGNGELLAEVHSKHPALRLAGTDISDQIISTNSTKSSEITYSTLDIEQAALPNQYDVVICTEVLEHCKNYNEALKNLLSMSKRYVILSVPCGPIFEIDKRVGHHQHFRKAQIERLLIGQGWQPIKVEEWGFPFFNLYKYLINLSPDKVCREFLSEKRYSFMQRLLSSLLLASFRLCLPWGGFQLFALAERQRN